MSAIKARLTGFATFVWNGEEKKLLGRGARSWAEIGAFYLVYYACLAGFFVGMLAVFYQTIDGNRPRLTGDSSLLKQNPGMGFKPMTDVEYTLVRFRQQPESYQPHVESIQKVLKPYLEVELAKEKKGIDCSQGDLPSDEEACRVNFTALTNECNIENKFGYEAKQPCLLLRLNKIFDWMPEKYTEENIKDSHASDELQQKMLADPDMIYIECVGENPADRDNMGKIEYYPEQGFRLYYYPFHNQDNYMSPLIFIKFMNPPENMALMIECRALSPNIKYDRTEKEGGVHFELLVDP